MKINSFYLLAVSTRSIQEVYSQYYEIDYIPTVMVPASLARENDSVYYPLQCPFSKINTFKTNQSSSAFSELEMLRNILLAYQEEFTEEQGAAFASPLYHVSKSTEFSFFHYQAVNEMGIENSESAFELDPRFQFSYLEDKKEFAAEAKLFRGCVRLSRL